MEGRTKKRNGQGYEPWTMIVMQLGAPRAILRFIIPQEKPIFL